MTFVRGQISMFDRQMNFLAIYNDRLERTEFYTESFLTLYNVTLNWKQGDRAPGCICAWG